jgi:hypothetical protein
MRDINYIEQLSGLTETEILEAAGMTKEQWTEFKRITAEGSIQPDLLPYQL